MPLQPLAAPSAADTGLTAIKPDEIACAGSHSPNHSCCRNRSPVPVSSAGMTSEQVSALRVGVCRRGLEPTGIIETFSICETAYSPRNPVGVLNLRHRDKQAYKPVRDTIINRMNLKVSAYAIS